MPSRRREHETALRKLSQRLGIETQYHDQYGNWHQVPETTLRALCATLGAAGDPVAALHDLETRPQSEQPRTIVVTLSRTDARVQLPFHDSATRLRWSLCEEGGATHSGELADGRTLQLPRSLSPGYHRLRVTDGKSTPLIARLIAAPARAYMPPRLQRDRIWGLSLQLYALRSPRNWGIGDFGDLGAVIGRAAALGADSVGINPLHATFPDEPTRASPYSPSSRLFVNPLYLDVEAIEDVTECPEAARFLASSRFVSLRHRLQKLPLVDYNSVARLKGDALRLLYLSFRRRHLQRRGDLRAAEFRAYQERAGAALRRFATFHALRETLTKNGQSRDWRCWPAPWQHPNSPTVAAFVRRHAIDIECLEYQQWQAERQLARVASTARDMAMAVGLYRDLAVGFDPAGADAWTHQHIVARRWTIGAPPDAWSPKGQDWGLSPLNPQRLQESGYAPLIETLRANMQHAGALRIDHILGLKRVFWVPEGGAPADGAYVRYPFNDLLGVVALESVRQRCLVVGEDLGTVPPGFSDELQRRGILSYRLLYFTRDARGGFLPAHRYPRQALAAISTHDLPTFAGYWRGRDIALRRRLALYPDRLHAKRDERARTADRRALTAMLKRTRPTSAPEEVPLAAAHRFLARTPARIVIAQIEDLLGLQEQVNVPGTVTQHPNWRRKLSMTIDAMFCDKTLGRTLAAITAERPSPQAPDLHVPRATYRLQLNGEFPFAAATAAVPYLSRLGISHLYLSPILEAQKGSTHGYDTTSFDRINPDLGGTAGFERLAEVARGHGLQLLVDFVPNHMGIGQARNAWWLDLLEWGHLSPIAEIFDIDWEPAAWPDLRGRLVVPMLGEEYQVALANGELSVRLDMSAGAFAVWYHEHCFPIRPFDYPILLEQLRTRASPKAAHQLDSLSRRFARLPRSPKAREAASELKRSLASWAHRHLRLKSDVPQSIGIAAEALDAVLQQQTYELANWRTAGRRINYRRFFDINQLAGVRMERPAVFERCHRLIAQLVAENKIRGLRLDHVDGLYDPAEYVRRLRRVVKTPFYLIVEKILGSDEELRADWPVDGTTGYEFANRVNGLFVRHTAAEPLARFYRQFTGRNCSFADEVRQAKYEIVRQLFGGELAALAVRIAQLDGGRPYGYGELTAGLADVIAELPVYRTYMTRYRIGVQDRRTISDAVARLHNRRRTSNVGALRFLEKVLTGPALTRHPEIRDIAMRFQQLSAPVQAKAVEDTAFYRHARLISLNEVGGDPGRFGAKLSAFHTQMRRQKHRRPQTLLATATHDTKRGEDARARIDVLSEIPRGWERRVRLWAKLNQPLRSELRTEPAPSRNDEYLIYQTLVGAWPMALTDERIPSQADLRELTERLVAYTQKAVREAKLRSSWLHPDLEYETACRSFVRRLLDPVRSRRFLRDFSIFIAEVARCGALNSLSQVALKLLMPGVPDIYRGCELWDLSLVDPDNRRSVSLDTGRKILDDMAANPPSVRDLGGDWRSGRLKLYLTWRLLALRQAGPGLFAAGTYEPLTVRGPAAEHVIAFRRRHGSMGVIVVAGRWFADLAAPRGAFVPAPQAWRGTTLPAELKATQAVEVLTGRTVESPLRLEELLAELPVAVIRTDS